MRRVLLSLLALLPACVGQRPYTPQEERPRVAYEARWWEEQGDHELQRAYATESLRIRERHFDYAIDDLRHARRLYYQELEALEASPAGDLDERIRPYPEIKYAQSGPIPKGRRDALVIEIDRLSAELEQLFRERPVQPQPPLPISERLVPKMD